MCIMYECVVVYIYVRERAQDYKLFEDRGHDFHIFILCQLFGFSKAKTQFVILNSDPFLLTTF